MYCFAYGSNLSRARLTARIPDARFVAVATLAGHRLSFHKVSRHDGSAKCDACYTGLPEDQVIGVVYDLPESGKQRLDQIEGLGAGYDEKSTAVVTSAGEVLQARLYVATDIDPDRRPFDWYKHHVLAGARENRLPEDYIAGIEAVVADRDPDADRRERELAIHAV